MHSQKNQNLRRFKDKESESVEETKNEMFFLFCVLIILDFNFHFIITNLS